MKARLVYLAGPIYDCDDTCVEWRKVTARTLAKKQIMSLSPMNRDYRGRESDPHIRKNIVEKDKKDIIMSDTVLALCEQPSFGTAMELLFAWSLQKQILVVTRHGSPWIRYHATKIFDSLDDAVASLEFDAR
jgi:nucleoside 2-deoxyribosyltransferase